MGAPLDSQQFESYVPVYDVAPETWEKGRNFLVEQIKKLANSINIREIGWYLDQEVLTGKAFIPGINTGGTSERYRTILRKVVPLGTLPNAGVLTVAHGITFDANFTLIDLHLSATDPVNFRAFGLAYWSNAAPGSIIVEMNANNIVVTTTSNYTAYTRCYAFIEYIQEL